MKGKRKTVIDVVRDAIARGASTVEEVVKSVSDMPLKKLGKLDPTRRLRKVQNESIGTVGEAIRDINEQVRAFAADKLAQARKAGLVPEAKTAGKKRAAQGGAREACRQGRAEKARGEGCTGKGCTGKGCIGKGCAREKAPCRGGAREAARREGVRHGDPSGEAQGGSRRARGVCRREASRGCTQARLPADNERRHAHAECRYAGG
jgi:hypothetical protein